MKKTIVCVLCILLIIYFLFDNVKIMGGSDSDDDSDYGDDDGTSYKKQYMEDEDLEERPYFNIDQLPLDKEETEEEKEELKKNTPQTQNDMFKGVAEPNGSLTPHEL